MPRFWNVPGCGLTFTLHTLDIMTDSGFLSTKSVFNYKEINIILNNPMVVSLATNYCVWIHTKVRLLYMAYLLIWIIHEFNLVLCVLFIWLPWQPAGLWVFFFCLHITQSQNHYAELWRHRTSETLFGYMLLSVCLRLSQFPQFSFIQYMELCVFSLPNSLAVIVTMCILSYYHHHHEIVSINH